MWWESNCTIFLRLSYFRSCSKYEDIYGNGTGGGPWTECSSDADCGGSNYTLQSFTTSIKCEMNRSWLCKIEDGNTCVLEGQDQCFSGICIWDGGSMDITSAMGSVTYNTGNCANSGNVDLNCGYQECQHYYNFYDVNEVRIKSN